MESPLSPAAIQPERRWRRLTRLLAVCCWAYLAGVLTVWVLLAWADLWWPATILLFSPRWLLGLPLAVLVPASALLRRRYLILEGITALVIAGPVMGFCIPWRNFLASAPDGMRLRVLTCNMHGHADVALVEDLAAEAEPDIVALQEWPEAGRPVLLTEPRWHTHRTPRLFLASRYPIKSATDLGLNSYGPHGSVIQYELETAAGLLSFFSLHLASPRTSIYETIHESRKGPRDVRANIARRWEQSERVAVFAAKVQGLVLLAGDFNTPPESAIFQEIWADYDDAFSTAGWGWGYTFYGAHTMVRIDHVLAGPGVTCTGCRVGPNIGSPHHPVLADVVAHGSEEN
jgi:endonuclease/exonuclease/phosphatase (EEP) superfamily protein YafD